MLSGLRPDALCPWVVNQAVVVGAKSECVAYAFAVYDAMLSYLAELHIWCHLAGSTYMVFITLFVSHHHHLWPQQTFRAAETLLAELL